MLVSALVTSVGINLGLCFLFFTLYSVLRKQPGNIVVYAPRLVEEGKSKRREDFNLERLLPTAGWLMRAWTATEDDILHASGLDALVFMRIFIFSFRIFAFAGIVGIFILLPINYFGNQTTDDIPSIPNKSLESFSISNVNNGSKRLWVHFCAAYIFTGVVCYLLYYEFRYISSKRIAYFNASKPQPHQFTVLVRNIPVLSGKSFSETVESFFREYYPTTYLAHSVVRKTGRLQGLIADAHKMYDKITHLKSRNDSKKKFKRDGFLGLFGRRVDIVNYYEKKLEDIEDDVRVRQTSYAGEEVPAAFVSFKSRFSTASALHIPQGNNPIEWVTERAPEPQEVHWPFFSDSFMKRSVCKLVVIVACIALTILFLIPVVLVQGLANLEELQIWFPFLKSILNLTIVSQVVTGYLPSLILQLFLACVPPIMIILSSVQGYTSYSQIEKSACIKLLWFTVWNIFFANVLSGTALSQVDVFLHPKEIAAVLAQAVPGQASFFISYVVTSGWTSLSSQLCQLVTLVFSWIKKIFCRNTNDKFIIPSVPYHSEIPRLLFFGLLGITYFFLAPLILPFLLVYYCLGYIIYRNQLLNVYIPKYETCGRFWPIVHSSTIFSLILMQIIAIGLFGLKKLPLASTLIIPLPILTLLFNEYCQNRFGPIFNAYSAECLISKDREDQNDPAMTEFYEKLATAYNDPAFLPINYAEGVDGHNTPLLHTAEA